MQRSLLFAVALAWVCLHGAAAHADGGAADDPPPGFNDDTHEPPPSPIAREAPPMLDDGAGGDLYSDPPNATDDAPKPPSYVTLSISPLHLLIPMLELQAEVRVMPYLGVAVIGGYGRVPAETSKGDTLHFDAWEVGGQVVYYPSDDFRAWQLGAEVLYLRVNVEDKIGSERVTGVGAGLTVGPLLGYKWVADMGFTLFLQGGFSMMIVHAKAENSLGQSATTKENDLLLLLNVNLGWCF